MSDRNTPQPYEARFQTQTRRGNLLDAWRSVGPLRDVRERAQDDARVANCGAQLIRMLKVCEEYFSEPMQERFKADVLLGEIRTTLRKANGR